MEVTQEDESHQVPIILDLDPFPIDIVGIMMMEHLMCHLRPPGGQDTVTEEVKGFTNSLN